MKGSFNHFLSAIFFVLVFLAAVLSRASGISGVPNFETADIDLGECCDESCIEYHCKEAMDRIYDFCGYGILSDGDVLSRKEAETYCKENDHWKCLVYQVEKSRGHDIYCGEEGMDGVFDDQYREPEEICGNVKRYLKQFCQVDLVGGTDFEKDDSDDRCGC